MSVQIGDRIKFNSIEGFVNKISDSNFTVNVYSSAIPNELNTNVVVDNRDFFKYGTILHKAEENTT